ncbi:hypothetical protein [Nocardiopsis listeri]|uniref:hypothetical protein n=1 Tax=Nocardiopsis listeri TaxID=53440 RepID=UPI0012ECEF79|nr:hypothetical protein [Nocardiopsis listeri]
MSPGPVSAELRAVLDAPRGRRFSRPHAPTTTALAREQRLLAQMADNPHGVLPLWAPLYSTRMTEDERRAHEVPELSERPESPWKPTPAPQYRPRPTIPRPRPAPDDGPPPPRPPRPPLPRRPRRPHSHRKPRRRHSRVGWRLCGYALATAAGALAHHLASPLL